MIVRISLRGDQLDLRHGDHRQEADEQQEEGEENPERANEGKDLHPGRVIVTPGTRQEILGERGGDNYEALKPHADVDEHADDKHRTPSLPGARPRSRRSRCGGRKSKFLAVTGGSDDGAVHEQVL